MAVIVPILSTFNDKGIKSAIREFQTAKNSIQKFGAVGKVFDGVGKSLTKNLTAPIIAVGGAMAFLVKEAAEVEAQQHRLRQLLLTTGGASAAQVSTLLSQADALEKVGVASKESIVSTQAQLATFDLQASTISKLTPAIVDYVVAEKGATASAEEYKSMTNGLAQALNGQFAALTRVGFVLDEDTKKKISNGTESERAAAIVEVLNSTYKDFNKSLAATPQGQMIILQREFGDLREELGKSLIPVFNDFVLIIKEDMLPMIQSAVTGIAKIIKSFTDLDVETRKNIIQFVGFLAVLGPTLIVFGKIIGVIYAVSTGIAALRAAMVLQTAATVGATAATHGLKAALISTGIGALVVLVGTLVAAFIVAYKTSDTFRDKVNTAINAVITVFENLTNGFRAAYNELVPIFNNILRFLQRFNPDIELMAEVGQVSFKKLKVSANSTIPDFFEMKRAMNDIGPAAIEAGNEGSKGLGKTGDAAEKLKKQIQALREAIVNLKQQAVDKLNDSLKDAEKQLDEAKGKFNDFKNSIAGNITSILDFGRAAEGENFVQGLVGQAADATAFANKVKQLIQLGLSERGITEVLNAGFEAGTRIADELIAGGTTVVQQVNTLLASVASVAEQVGDFGAKQFYQAGVTQGEALVNGILDSLRAAQAELAAAQKAALSGGGIGDFKNLGARATGLLGQIQGLSGKAQANALADFSRALEQSKGAPAISTKELTSIQKKYKLAKGGIVLGPTNALIGEAGPEAVVPLSGANSARGALGSTINITVNAGIGTDGAQVGKQVVDAIKRYERISGPVFAKA